MQLTNFSDASPRGIFLLYALQDLTENGSQQLSLDRISKKSGIQNSYQDADELRVALAIIGFQELEYRMRMATPVSLPFEERLFQICRAYLEMASESPALLQLMFGIKDQTEEETDSQLKETGDRAFAVLADIMRDAITGDQLKTNDCRSAALATWSFIHGFSFLMIRSGKSYKEHPDDLMEMYQKLRKLLSKNLVSAKSN